MSFVKSALIFESKINQYCILRAKLLLIMNKVKFYFILPLLTIVLFSCSKDDEAQLVPPRDYAEQYSDDLDSIESYLKNHSFTVIEESGRIDVKIDTFIVANTEGIVSIWDNTDYPLQFKMVKSDVRSSSLVDGGSTDPVEYKMYYLLINEGGGASTTRFDSTFVSYRGWKLNNEQFDINNTPSWFTFPSLSQGQSSFISGFRQFLPLLKAAQSFAVGSDGDISYNNYGVGVLFLPSGLAYYNRSQPNIPAYSPLVFTVRLHSVNENDHDRDGILSKYENGDGVEDLYSVDTDGDNIPDFLDIDDDNDNVRTILETRFTYVNSQGVTVNGQYPFNGMSVDNPETPFDDTLGIPNCAGDFTSPTRLRKHLDASCQ
jgi:FKBP-type peptidyl-prolyl cis-trans isomerase FkpA